MLLSSESLGFVNSLLHRSSVHLAVCLIADAHTESDILQTLHREQIRANQHAEAEGMTGVALTHKHTENEAKHTIRLITSAQ